MNHVKYHFVMKPKNSLGDEFKKILLGFALFYADDNRSNESFCCLIFTSKFRRERGKSFLSKCFVIEVLIHSKLCIRRHSGESAAKISSASNILSLHYP